MSDLRAAGTMRNRTTLGLVLVAIGLVFALGSAGVVRTDGIGRWWPLLLIGIGIVKVRQPREDGQKALGVAFLLLGGLFQLTSILTFGSSWTLVMIGFGMFLLWQGIEGPRTEKVPSVMESSFLSDMALIGYLKRRHDSPEFRGGSVTAVMGGVELDLRKAVMAGDAAVLDVVAFWGGIEIKVPREWTVDAQVVPLMGAFENKLDSLSAAGAPRLILRGHAIMGAVAVGS